MVVRSGDRQVVFVSLDLIGVDKRMVADLGDRVRDLGITEEQLVVGGTHTHSGLGTLTRRPSLALIAVDRFRRDNYEQLLDDVADSIRLATQRLETVELLRGEFRTEGLQRNKWRRHRGEEHYDDRARLLLARSATNGQILGGILNYALHGNGMPIADLRYSSDVLGQIELNMERTIAAHNDRNHYAPVVLFMNAAEGDVGNPQRSEDAVMADGRRFAVQAVASGVLDRLEPVEPTIAVARREVWLGWPALPLGTCVDEADVDETRTRPDIRLPLPLMQKRSTVSALRIGPVLMLTWPGEPSTQVGYDAMARAADLGFDDTWLLGLTNDYQSYFTTKDEFFEGVYDSCSSLFGWKGALRIHRAHEALIREL